jgi:hypothetical protein
VLKDSDVRDGAAKTPFGVNHGFLRLQTGGWAWIEVNPRPQMSAEWTTAPGAAGCRWKASSRRDRDEAEDRLGEDERHRLTSRVCTSNFFQTSNSSRVATTVTSAMAIPIPLQEALRDSITSGTFIDTKFWVFSKRTSKPGRVVKPKALFVSGHVVRRVPRLASRTAHLFG